MTGFSDSGAGSDIGFGEKYGVIGDMRTAPMLLVMVCAHVTVPFFRARRKKGNITWAQLLPLFLRALEKGHHNMGTVRTLDGRRASTILRIFVDELCSRSGGDAREAMTVGCKPTMRTLPFLEHWPETRSMK